jgi:predicted RecA/RadA family phage recombinase
MAKEAELLSKDYDVIKVTPAAAASAGEVLTFNEQIGFLIEDITAAEVAAAEARAMIVKADIVKVPKNGGETWAEGEAIYFDAAASDFTNVAGALDVVGFCREDAALADTHGFIRWDGSAEFLKT